MDRRELYDRLQSFSVLYLQYAQNLQDISKNGIIRDNERLNRSLNEAKTQCEQVLLLSEEMKAHPEAVEHLVKLLYNMILPSIQVQDLPEDLKKKSSDLRDFRNKIQNSLMGLKNSRKNDHGTRFEFKKTIRTKKGSVNIRIYVHDLQFLLRMVNISDYEMNNTEISKLMQKPSLLEEMAANFAAEIISIIFGENPMLFGNNINLVVVLTMSKGTFAYLSKFSSYAMTLPFNHDELVEMLLFKIGRINVKDTLLYKTAIHELAHFRDLSMSLADREAVYLASALSKEPSKNLVQYLILINFMKIEGYATFFQWVGSSRIGDTMILCPQDLSMSRQRGFIHQINDMLIQYDDRLKELYKSWNPNFDIIELKDVAYLIGSYTFTLMLLYHLRSYLNDKMYVLFSEENYMQKDFGLKILSNNGDPNYFWEIKKDQREQILKQKRVLSMKPADIGKIKNGNFMILISPELWPKVEILLKLFSMDLKEFYKDAKAAYEYCCLKGRILLEKEFIEAVEDQLSKLDKEMLNSIE